MNKEIWVPVPVDGYSQHYEISSLGRCRSLRTGKLLAACRHTTGYRQYHLHDPALGRKAVTAHRLVALAFIPQVPGKDYINHRDFDRTNNQVGNLEWCTSRENILHCRAAGRANTYKVPVVGVRADGFGYWFPHQVSAEEHLRGKRTGGICLSIKTGRTMYGFKWEAARHV